jgi:hypothetical protein
MVSIFYVSFDLYNLVDTSSIQVQISSVASKPPDKHAPMRDEYMVTNPVITRNCYFCSVEQAIDS